MTSSPAASDVIFAIKQNIKFEYYMMLFCNRKKLQHTKQDNDKKE